LVLFLPQTLTRVSHRFVVRRRYRRTLKVAKFIQRKLRARMFVWNHFIPQIGFNFCVPLIGQLMRAARKQWLLTKEAAIILQTVVLAHHSVLDRYEHQYVSETFYAYMMTRVAMEQREKQIGHVIWLQRYIRARAQTRTYRRAYHEQRKAILVIQAHIRQVEEQREMMQQLEAIKTLQATIIAAATQKRTRLVHGAVVFMQTRARLTAVARRIRYVTRIQVLTLITLYFCLFVLL
jgi:hypothetical protein